MVSWLFKHSSLLRRHSIFRGGAQGVTRNLYFFRLEFLSTSLKAPRCSVESAQTNLEDKKLFTANYLISTFGFTPQKAHASTKRFTFETPDKPDSVISFLYNHGFTNTQVSNIAQKFPSLLMSDPEKVLLPKIEFFKSLGFSNTDVASIVFASPYILHRSLEKQLIPSVWLLKRLFQSDVAMLAALKRCGNRILLIDLKSTLVPNMEYLKQLGVPESNIMRMLTAQPRTLSQSHVHFTNVVGQVMKLGVNPGKYVLLMAIRAIVSRSKENWEKKMKFYMHWGFTEEGILEAFRKHPQFMTYSVDKVTDLMSYLVHEMGFQSSLVIERPQLLDLSLQKRIIPRCSVYRILSEKNLLPKKSSIRYLLEDPEKKFLKRYVAPFEAQVPELLNLYTKQASLLSTSLKFNCSEIAGKNEDKKLFTVNYLITKLGFTPQKAHSSTKLITFETPDKPDSLISFLYNHGLTKTQISYIAQRLPSLLMSDPDKVVLPKIEFFKSLGFSKTDVASVVSASPPILHRSLEKHLIPSIRLLKSLFQSDDEMLAALKRCGNRILLVDVKSTLVPNMEYLKQLGVPESNILRMLTAQPRTLSHSHVHFRNVVDQVMKLGVNPGKYVLLLAIQAIVSISKENWEKKMKFYMHWGFTEVGILEAFRKQPHIMMHSMGKVTESMSYLINEMGFKSSLVIERPQLLRLSLKKRIIPRCSVYRILSEKNLLPKKLSIRHFLEDPEKKFLIRFLAPFEAQVPELLNLYTKQASCLSTSLKFNCSEFSGKNEDKKLFTLNYLITTLGFSPEKAHASTNHFTFETPDKPDSVISFLYNHGLTKTQISNIAQRCPQLIMSDPEKILLPKLEFLKSLGFSKTDVASIVFASPYKFTAFEM